MTTETRYSKAVWRGEGMPFAGKTGSLTQARLIVIHVMQGTLAGTDAWFHNPDSQVSAHFGVGKDGTVYQWVALDQVAWAERDYNDAAYSIEHEGFSGEKLTEPQLEASVKLIDWLAELIEKERGLRAGVASLRTNLQSGVGVIGHGELGIPGGNHPDCPGAPIIDQFNVALRPTAKKAVIDTAKSVEISTMKEVAKVSTGTTVKVPTKSQTAVFVAEAGALVVYINDFIKFAHPGGTELVMLNAAAAGVTWISHHFNKKKAAAQSTATTPTTTSGSAT
jgi:hypothetical protein